MSLAGCFVFRWYTRYPNIVYLLLGISYAQIYCFFQLQEKLTHPPNEPVTVSGIIVNLPDTNIQRTRFLFRAENSAHQDILLHWYWNDTSKIRNLKSGQKWRFEVSLKPPNGLANATGFDYARWLFRHGIDALGTVRSGQLLPTTQTFNSNSVHQLREQLRGWLDQQFTQQPARGLVKALTIGDKTDIPRAQQQLLQTSGAAHLLAISGLHIGIIATLGYQLGWLLFYLWRPRRWLRPQIQSVAAFSCACLYTLLAGFSIPTLRALLMLSVVLLALQRRRGLYSWDIYATALFVVLLYDPLSVLDMGFWLSFGAVLVLLLAFRGRRRQANWLAFTRAQWAILIGLLPISALLFGTVQGFAPLINLLLIPLMSIVLMPLLFLALLLGGLLSNIPTTLIQTIELCIDVFSRIMQDISQWQWLQWPLATPTLITWLCLLLFAAIMLLPAVMPKRWLAWVLLTPLFFPANKQLSDQTADITFFDVGQGLSILIETRNHRLLYDTGAASASGFSMVNAVVLPTLKKNRIQSLDKVILSHADNDHAGGYSGLAEHISIEQTLAGFSGYEICQAGHTWVWDGVLFEILSPFNVSPYLGNNSSCVLRVSTAQHSMLITGDIESPVEYRLQQFVPDQLNASILSVPHHGSNSSSTGLFLDAVNPRLAINSSAYANRFNHPTDTVKTRYQQRGIVFLDTQTHGSIRVQLGKEISVDCFLSSHRRLWRVADLRAQKSPQQCGLFSNILNVD